MEKEGRDYYKKLEHKSGQIGLKRIFNMLSNEEVKHMNIIKKIKEESDFDKESILINNVKSIFADLDSHTLSDEISQLDAYGHALKIEKESISFYQEKIGSAVNDKQKEAYTFLQDEEEKHFLIIKNIIDFVNHPNLTVDDAEWHRLEKE